MTTHAERLADPDFHGGPITVGPTLGQTAGDIMSECYVVRECQGKVLKRGWFFGGDYVRYEHDINRFGAWFVGPFPSREKALLYSLPGHPRDKQVSIDEMDRVLVEVLNEHCGLPPRRERYLSAKNLADLPKLLSDLHDINRKWTELQS
jgi:hypothetical protein